MTSMAEMTVLAPFPPPRPFPRCELARRARAAGSEPRAYLQGYLQRHVSLDGVAAEMGVTTRTVYNWLYRYRITVKRERS